MERRDSNGDVTNINNNNNGHDQDSHLTTSPVTRLLGTGKLVGRLDDASWIQPRSDTTQVRMRDGSRERFTPKRLSTGSDDSGWIKATTSSARRSTGSDDPWLRSPMRIRRTASDSWNISSSETSATSSTTPAEGKASGSVGASSGSSSGAGVWKTVSTPGKLRINSGDAQSWIKSDIKDTKLVRSHVPEPVRAVRKTEHSYQQQPEPLVKSEAKLQINKGNDQRWTKTDNKDSKLNKSNYPEPVRAVHIPEVTLRSDSPPTTKDAKLRPTDIGDVRLRLQSFEQSLQKPDNNEYIRERSRDRVPKIKDEGLTARGEISLKSAIAKFDSSLNQESGTKEVEEAPTRKYERRVRELRRTRRRDEDLFKDKENKNNEDESKADETIVEHVHLKNQNGHDHELNSERLMSKVTSITADENIKAYDESFPRTHRKRDTAGSTVQVETSVTTSEGSSRTRPRRRRREISSEVDDNTPPKEEFSKREDERTCDIEISEKSVDMKQTECSNVTSQAIEEVPPTISETEIEEENLQTTVDLKSEESKSISVIDANNGQDECSLIEDTIAHNNEKSAEENEINKEPAHDVILSEQITWEETTTMQENIPTTNEEETSKLDESVADDNCLAIGSEKAEYGDNEVPCLREERSSVNVALSCLDDIPFIDQDTSETDSYNHVSTDYRSEFADILEKESRTEAGMTVTEYSNDRDRYEIEHSANEMIRRTEDCDTREDQVAEVRPTVLTVSQTQTTSHMVCNDESEKDSVDGDGTGLNDQEKQGFYRMHMVASNTEDDETGKTDFNTDISVEEVNTTRIYETKDREEENYKVNAGHYSGIQERYESMGTQKEEDLVVCTESDKDIKSFQERVPNISTHETIRNISTSDTDEGTDNFNEERKGDRISSESISVKVLSTSVAQDDIGEMLESAIGESETDRDENGNLLDADRQDIVGDVKDTEKISGYSREQDIWVQPWNLLISAQNTEDSMDPCSEEIEVTENQSMAEAPFSQASESTFVSTSMLQSTAQGSTEQDDRKSDIDIHEDSKDTRETHISYKPLNLRIDDGTMERNRSDMPVTHAMGIDHEGSNLQLGVNKMEITTQEGDESFIIHSLKESGQKSEPIRSLDNEIEQSQPTCKDSQIDPDSPELFDYSDYNPKGLETGAVLGNDAICQHLEQNLAPEGEEVIMPSGEVNEMGSGITTVVRHEPTIVNPVDGEDNTCSTGEEPCQDTPGTYPTQSTESTPMHLYSEGGNTPGYFSDRESLEQCEYKISQHGISAYELKQADSSDSKGVDISINDGSKSVFSLNHPDAESQQYEHTTDIKEERISLHTHKEDADSGLIVSKEEFLEHSVSVGTEESEQNLFPRQSLFIHFSEENDKESTMKHTEEDQQTLTHNYGDAETNEHFNEDYVGYTGDKLYTYDQSLEHVYESTCGETLEHQYTQREEQYITDTNSTEVEVDVEDDTTEEEEYSNDEGEESEEMEEYTAWGLEIIQENPEEHSVQIAKEKSENKDLSIGQERNEGAYSSGYIGNIVKLESNASYATSVMVVDDTEKETLQEITYPEEDEKSIKGTSGTESELDKEGICDYHTELDTEVTSVENYETISKTSMDISYNEGYSNCEAVINPTEEQSVKQEMELSERDIVEDDEIRESDISQENELSDGNILQKDELGERDISQSDSCELAVQNKDFDQTHSVGIGGSTDYALAQVAETITSTVISQALFSLQTTSSETKEVNTNGLQNTTTDNDQEEMGLIQRDELEQMSKEGQTAEQSVKDIADRISTVTLSDAMKTFTTPSHYDVGEDKSQSESSNDDDSDVADHSPEYRHLSDQSSSDDETSTGDDNLRVISQVVVSEVSMSLKSLPEGNKYTTDSCSYTEQTSETHTDENDPGNTSRDLSKTSDRVAEGIAEELCEAVISEAMLAMQSSDVQTKDNDVPITMDEICTEGEISGINLMGDEFGDNSRVDKVDKDVIDIAEAMSAAVMVSSKESLQSITTVPTEDIPASEECLTQTSSVRSLLVERLGYDELSGSKSESTETDEDGRDGQSLDGYTEKVKTDDSEELVKPNGSNIIASVETCVVTENAKPNTEFEKQSFGEDSILDYEKQMSVDKTYTNLAGGSKSESLDAGLPVVTNLETTLITSDAVVADSFGVGIENSEMSERIEAAEASMFSTEYNGHETVPMTSDVKETPYVVETPFADSSDDREYMVETIIDKSETLEKHSIHMTETTISAMSKTSDDKELRHMVETATDKSKTSDDKESAHISESHVINKSKSSEDKDAILMAESAIIKESAVAATSDTDKPKVNELRLKYEADNATKLDVKRTEKTHTREDFRYIELVGVPKQEPEKTETRGYRRRRRRSRSEEQKEMDGLVKWLSSGPYRTGETKQTKMLNGDICYDQLILEVFEESETIFFPIQAQKEARAFIKALHMKGVSYETLCQEIGEHEHNFTSWRKSLGRAGIGNSVMQWANRPLQDLLDDGEEDEDDGMDDADAKAEEERKKEEAARLREQEGQKRLQPSVDNDKPKEVDIKRKDQRDANQNLSTGSTPTKPVEKNGVVMRKAKAESPPPSQAKKDEPELKQKYEQEPDLIRLKRLEEFKREQEQTKQEGIEQVQDIRKRISMFEEKQSPSKSGSESREGSESGEQEQEDESKTDSESLSSSSGRSIEESESSPEPEEPKAKPEEPKTPEPLVVEAAPVVEHATKVEHAPKVETPQATSKGKPGSDKVKCPLPVEADKPKEQGDSSVPADVTENYNSDLDPDNDMHSPVQAIAARKIASSRINKTWSGFLYVFSDTPANSKTCRVKVGASAFPHKRLRQAQLFNPDIYQVHTVAVKQRSAALEQVLVELEPHRLQGKKDWFEGPFDDILAAISDVAARFPSSRKIIESNNDDGNDESAC